MISYTNTIKENVLDSLDKIVGDEFTDIPVFYDLDVIARGNTFFVFQPQTDELLEQRVSSDVREFTVLIRLFRKSAGDHRKHTELDPVTKTIERLKRLIANNSDYTPSSTYKWHDGRITSIDYQVNNEELPEYKIIDVAFACVVEEVLS
jgi:hypothetical protein